MTEGPFRRAVPTTLADRPAPITSAASAALALAGNILLSIPSGVDAWGIDSQRLPAFGYLQNETARSDPFLMCPPRARKNIFVEKPAEDHVSFNFISMQLDVRLQALFSRREDRAQDVPFCAWRGIGGRP